MAYNKQSRDNAVRIFKMVAQNDDHRLSGDLKGAINAGQVYFTPETLYVRKNMDGAGGLQQLLDATTEKVAGVSSFQGDKLPKKKAAFYDGIRVLYATGDDASEGKVDYKAGTSIPKELINADLVISQNGREQLRISVGDTVSGAANIDRNENYYELPGNLLRDDEAIQIALQFPKGVSMPTHASTNDYSYVGVSLRAVVTK